MTNILSTILLSCIFTILIMNKFKLNCNIKKGTILSIIISFITILISKLIFSDIKLIHITISFISSIFINTLLLTNNINTKYLLKSGFVIFLFFISSILQYIPIYLLNWDINNLTTNNEVILTLFSDLILVIILIFIYRKDLKKDFIDAKNNFYNFFENSFKIWFIGLMLMMVSNLIIIFFIQNASANNENAVQSMIDASPYLTLICAGILAPIIEELTFRKAFKDVFKNKYVFIFVSGFIFGLLHVIFSYNSLIDLIYLFPYAFLGGSFAYMVDKTNNNLSSIMMHMIHNSALTILSILTGMIIL